jgi:hypothetical protein
LPPQRVQGIGPWEVYPPPRCGSLKHLGHVRRFAGGGFLRLRSHSKTTPVITAAGSRTAKNRAKRTFQMDSSTR